MMAVTTVVVSAAISFRWGWRAWPALLGSALLTPLFITLLFMAFAYQHGGGFVIHWNALVLMVGVPSMLVGFGVAILTKRSRTNGR